jgi:hypothetical protein
VRDCIAVAYMAKNKQSGKVVGEVIPPAAIEETAVGEVIPPEETAKVLSFAEEKKKQEESRRETLAEATNALTRIFTSEHLNINPSAVVGKVNEIVSNATIAQETANKAFSSVGQLVADLKRLFDEANSKQWTKFLFSTYPYDKCGFKTLTGGIVSPTTAKTYLNLHFASQSLPMYVPALLIEGVRHRYGSAFKQVKYGKVIAFLASSAGEAFCKSHRCNAESIREDLRELDTLVSEGRDRQETSTATKLSEALTRIYLSNAIGKEKKIPPAGNKKRHACLLDIQRLVENLNEFESIFPRFRELDIEIEVSYKSSKLADEIAKLDGSSRVKIA